MANYDARRHVQKGIFALLVGWVMMTFYEKWEITGWLGEVDNVLVSMVVVILPLILATEMVFMLFHFIKDKLEDIAD